MYVPAPAVPTIKTALASERSAKVDRHRVTVVEAPDGFVGRGGVSRHQAGRGRSGPAPRPDRARLDVRGAGTPHPGQQRRNAGPRRADRPVRIPSWFRSVGDPSEPGTMLVTLTGGSRDALAVLEVPTGTQLTDLVGHVGVTDSGSLARRPAWAGITAAGSRARCSPTPDCRAQAWPTSAPVPVQASSTHCRRISAASRAPRTSSATSPTRAPANAARASTVCPDWPGSSTISPTAESTTASSPRCTG